MSNDLSIHRLTKTELRRMFNDGGYWSLAQAGVLLSNLQRDGHPSPEHSGEPYCTRSQIIGYYDQGGNRVAVVHQYLRPDGTVGGSGKPDPKHLVEGDIVYRPSED